ncbi:MAG: reactive intermediate/imine deaminase [Acidobacteria bacterium]|nr:MAG: reactive intermediate/imine deaminase [Acidobacteria bacterium 13_1_40CM_2_68_10]PYT35950.1 MAG: reactive intermediate/imine deaminase [Acidobacteriota bacterium]
MSARTVSTDNAPRAIGPYSQGTAAAGFLFLSGQVALDPKTGALVQGTIREEVARVLENLRAVLEAAGTGLDRVVRTTVYLTSLKEFEAMNEVYARYFGENRPARSTVQVAALPKGARVEIDAIAILG